MRCRQAASPTSAACARRIEPAHAADLLPRGLGRHGGGGGRIRADLPRLLAHPLELRPEPRREHGVDRVEVADVGGGIGELRVAQRPALPVGPLLLLRERHAEQLLRRARRARSDRRCPRNAAISWVSTTPGSVAPNRVANRPRSWRGAWATTQRMRRRAPRRAGRRRRRSRRPVAPAVRTRRSCSTGASKLSCSGSHAT